MFAVIKLNFANLSVKNYWNYYTSPIGSVILFIITYNPLMLWSILMRKTRKYLNKLKELKKKKEKINIKNIRRNIKK